jgi:hypothetical protein
MLTSFSFSRLFLIRQTLPLAQGLCHVAKLVDSKSELSCLNLGLPLIFDFSLATCQG